METNGYWSLTAGNGLTGGTYKLDVDADGFTGVTDYQKLKIVKRVNSSSPWTSTERMSRARVPMLRLGNRAGNDGFFGIRDRTGGHPGTGLLHGITLSLVWNAECWYAS